jgi:hypothetical protein
MKVKGNSKKKWPALKESTPKFDPTTNAGISSGSVVGTQVVGIHPR